MGKWTHVAFVVDPATTEVRVWFDGVKVGSGLATMSFALIYESFFGFSWDGVLDEVRLYRRALEPAEVATLAGL